MLRYSKSLYTKIKGEFTTCGIFRERKTNKEEAHIHDFIEIIYVLDGKATEHINNSSFVVSKGDLLFINYNSTHSFEPIGTLDYVNVVFNPDDILSRNTESSSFQFIVLSNFEELRKRDERLFTFFGKERKELEDILEIMLIESRSNGKYADKILSDCLNILISMVINKVNLNNESVDSWLQMINFINDNITDKLTLNELAKKCSYNPSYFSRIFKEKMGITLSRYLTSKRIDKAKELLVNGETIERIISETGFSGKAALYQAFFEFENISLTEYRKLHSK